MKKKEGLLAVTRVPKIVLAPANFAAVAERRTNGGRGWQAHPVAVRVWG
jgi:hypothetical protein